MNTNRINYRVIVGSNEVTQEMMDKVLAPICERYGGATYTQGQGCWAEDGDETKEVYSNVAREVAHIVDISVPKNEADTNFIQACFIPVAPVATWVHVELTETRVHHFNVSELAQEAMIEADNRNDFSRMVELMKVLDW